MKSCSLDVLSAEVLHDTRRFSEQAPVLTEVPSTHHFLSSIAGIFHQSPIMEEDGKTNTESKSSRIMKNKKSSKEKDILIVLKLKTLLFHLGQMENMDSSIFKFHLSLLFLN